MPRKGRNNKGFVAIPISGGLSLTTLGNNTVIKSDVISGNFTEDFFAISVDLNVSVDDITAGELLPAEWGVCHGDYTVAQVNENLNVALLGPGNKIQQEQARRLVRRGGVFKSDPVLTTKLQTDFAGMKRIKLKFVVQDGKALQIWIKNRSGSPLTTGSQLVWSGTLYGRWLL